MDYPRWRSAFGVYAGLGAWLCLALEPAVNAWASPPQTPLHGPTCLQDILDHYLSFYEAKNLKPKDMTVGVEIEGVIPRFKKGPAGGSGRLGVAEMIAKTIRERHPDAKVGIFEYKKTGDEFPSYKVLYQIGDRKMAWDVTSDPSLTSRRNAHGEIREASTLYTSLEVISPVLSQGEDHALLAGVVQGLKEHGIKTPIDRAFFSAEIPKERLAKIERLIPSLEEMDGFLSGRPDTRTIRYLNLNLQTEGKGTVEFRLFNSILNKDAVRVMTRFSSEFILRARNQDPKLIRLLRSAEKKEPTFDEIAQALDMDAGEYRPVLDAVYRQARELSVKRSRIGLATVGAVTVASWTALYLIGKTLWSYHSLEEGPTRGMGKKLDPLLGIDQKGNSP